MANDRLTAAVCANKDVPDCKPGPFQDCRDVVHIAVFFDGTGNNKDVDAAKKKWSNIARMHLSAVLFSEEATAHTKANTAFYPIYISGVGTPYNGKAVNWMDDAESWVQDGWLGSGGGMGGDRRLEQGEDMVNYHLRNALLANAKKLGGTIKQYAEASGNKSFADVNTALGNHRLIKMINLSIIGFSRGAALARVFSNRILAACEQKDGAVFYKGYPIRFNFMGLFDTVASFGLPAKNLTLPFKERELIVSPVTERCIHYVAAHELRYAFPVDLIRKNGQLPSGSFEEKTYPGVHSDVGGGYEPIEQNINDNYGRIPLRDMMREAVASGVRMFSYETLNQDKYKALFQERFECKPETEAAYNSYMTACRAQGGTIENQVKRHMEMLYSAYGTLHRAGKKNSGEISRQDKWIGPLGMAWEIDKYRKAVKVGKTVRLGSLARGYAQYVKPFDWQINAWDSTAPKGVVDFVSQFVHDSKVDFLGNVEPFSYFRPRGIQESTISIWQEGGNWISDKAHTVGDAVDSGYNSAKTKAGEAVDATTQAAYDAADAAKRKADEAAAYAQRKAHEAEVLASKAYDATAKAASDAADLAKRKAKEAADAANQAYEAAAQKAKVVANATEQTINTGEVVVERIYEKGKYWVRTITSTE